SARSRTSAFRSPTDVDPLARVPPASARQKREEIPLRRTSCERGADVLQARGVRRGCRRHGPGRAGSMAKSGEIDYLKNLSPADVWHAVHKPFSDDNCAGYL